MNSELTAAHLPCHRYYITYIFQMAGYSGNIALISSSIQYVINVLMTVPALLFVDKWGRRPTLLIGSTLMATFLFINAAILATKGHYYEPNTAVNSSDNDAVRWKIPDENHSAAVALIAMTYLFVASFAPTWGPVSWIYPPELFPTRLRAKSNSLSTVSNWVMNCALAGFVPPGFKNIQWKVYLVFGIFCVAMTVHVFFCFPETKNLTLEEAEEMFAAGQPAWRTRGLTGSSKLHEIADKIERGDNPDAAAKEALGYTANHSGDTASEEEKK